MNESRIAMSRMQSREAFVMPETADIFAANMQQFVQTQPEHAAALQEAAFVSLEQAYSATPSAREDRKPFVYQDGVAIIPVHGALLNRFSGAYSFATGYNYIRHMMNAAMADDDVQTIVLDVDSPGGESSGCFELANEIRDARDSKPIVAVVDSLACSAGYAIASAASNIFATPSSKIGSIGVYVMHMDLSGAMEKQGVKVTFIEAPEGGMKTAGNPFQRLGTDARKQFQTGVNKTYDDFVELVAANRDMDDASVRETKARVFRADEALALGLIDEVKTPAEALSALIAELAEDSDATEEEDEQMATQGKPAAAAAPTTEATSAPVVDVQAAITADRERMTAIKALPEAAERPKLADHLALSGMDVDAAKATLAIAAVETVAAPAPAGEPPVDGTNHLDKAMANSQHPEVGAGADGTAAAAAGTGEPSDEDLSAAILKDHSAMVGVTYEAPKAA